MKIGMIQHNPIIGDFSGNAEKIIEMHQKSVLLGAEIVVAPELALWGYPPQDRLLSISDQKKQEDVLTHVINTVNEIPLVLGISRKNLKSGPLCLNSALFVQNRTKILTYDKQLLPEYDVFDEKRYFRAGKKTSSSFVFNGKRCAVRVCEDIWNGSEIPGQHKLYDVDPIAQLEGQGVEVLFVINGSPYYWGKGNVRFELVSEIAKRLHCVVVYVNEVGGNDELVFDGRSFAVNEKGKCIAVAKTYQEDIVVFDTDGPEVSYPFDHDDVSELYRALVLSIHDYAGKCGFKDAVIGLSGGVDSALVLALAVDALGREHLEAVMMPSKYTADMSNEDAYLEAEALGVKHNMIPIEAAVQIFGTLLAEEFAGYAPDVTEENIQARCRGLLLMAISNKKGSLLLSTGNKSEMSVGYATLYGDMAGGFAPIKDIPKLVVYRLCEYRNSISSVIPERVLTRPPSAELAPGQIDQNNLPPYAVLDPILELYVEDSLSYEEIVAQGFEPATVNRVIKLVNRAEYKRKQGAPGTKVTLKSFGSGRRFPVATKYE